LLAAAREDDGSAATSYANATRTTAARQPRIAATTLRQTTDVRVTWDQVLTWRLRRQFLDPRSSADAEAIVSRLCGEQAQVASAAEQTVELRQRPAAEPGGVRAALERGSLVKTWAMRGTLHLLRSSELGAYLSLLASGRTWTRPVWQRAF
jgi:hypothetical protein